MWRNIFTWFVMLYICIACPLPCDTHSSVLSALNNTWLTGPDDCMLSTGWGSVFSANKSLSLYTNTPKEQQDKTCPKYVHMSMFWNTLKFNTAPCIEYIPPGILHLKSNVSHVLMPGGCVDRYIIIYPHRTPIAGWLESLKVAPIPISNMLRL